MKQDNRLALLDNLKKFKEGGYKSELGICCACNFDLISTLEQRKVFETWEYFSGSYTYPIPSHDGRVKPGTEFNKSIGRDAMYGDNPYGNLRKDLLEHCINYLESYKG